MTGDGGENGREGFVFGVYCLSLGVRPFKAFTAVKRRTVNGQRNTPDADSLRPSPVASSP